MAELEGPAPEKRHGTRHSIARWVRPFLAGIGSLILLFGLFVLLWMVPKWEVAGIVEHKDRLAAESAFRQTLVQLIGGVALLGGLYYTAQTLQTSQKILQANQETLWTTQQGQITERFTKAIEHLGDTRLTVRLGGIYALERIARDSPKDHWQIMEVLTTYIRDNAPWTPETPQLPQDNQALEDKQAGKTNQPLTSQEPSPKLASDIQAVLTVLGRRIRSSDREGENRLDLTKTDLRRASLGGADLEGASLDDANLNGAFLGGANLKRATLGGSSLKHAFLEGADLKEAHLSNADLKEAFLADADLRGATLYHADLKGAFLAGADLKGAFLAGADLKGAKGLTIAQVAAVRIIGRDSLDPLLMEQIQREQPELFGRL